MNARDTAEPPRPAVIPMGAAQGNPWSEGQVKSEKRFARILHALLQREQSREQIDRIAGASNGPDEIMRIKRMLGFNIRCNRRPCVDRDGRRCQSGWYSLSEESRVDVIRWLERANRDEPASGASPVSPAKLPPPPSTATAPHPGAALAQARQAE